MEPRPSLAELRWRCRRGMLELDLLLRRFVEQRYAELSNAQVRALGAALAVEDDQLWDWLSGRARPEEQGIAEIVEFISGRR